MKRKLLKLNFPFFIFSWRSTWCCFELRCVRNPGTFSAAAVGDKASCLISRNSPSLLFAPSYSLHRTVTLNQVLQFFFNFYGIFSTFQFFPTSCLISPSFLFTPSSFLHHTVTLYQVLQLFSLDFSIFLNLPQASFSLPLLLCTHCQSQSGSSRMESTALEITEECTSPPKEKHWTQNRRQ